MTVQRYSVKEALNRIYRIFRGDSLVSDQPESLAGTVYSEDETFSRLAELVQGSLPGETFTLPAGTPGIPYTHGHEIGLAVYEDNTFRVSGTAFVFEDGLWVTTTGSYAYIGVTGSALENQEVLFSFDGALTVQTGLLRVRNLGTDRTITRAYAEVSVAPSGSSIIADVHKDGTTIFTTPSNRPTITENTFTDDVTTIEVPVWANDEYLTADIDQIGSGTAGSNMVLHVVYNE